MKQQHLFSMPRIETNPGKFVSVYRVSLVKDQKISFEQGQLSNSRQAHAFAQKLIRTRGQPDREQFCVILLNAKNEITGINIVSTGSVSSTPVHPREVFKPAILTNSSALILCHNHPSGNTDPSPEDIVITQRIIQAAEIIGLQVHEHLIISMMDDRYFSFADQGLIARFYREINNPNT